MKGTSKMIENVTLSVGKPLRFRGGGGLRLMDPLNIPDPLPKQLEPILLHYSSYAPDNGKQFHQYQTKVYITEY